MLSQELLNNMLLMTIIEDSTKEWKVTISNTIKLLRRKSFMNSDINPEKTGNNALELTQPILTALEPNKKVTGMLLSTTHHLLILNLPKSQLLIT